jgi:hypothetical protein
MTVFYIHFPHHKAFIGKDQAVSFKETAFLLQYFELQTSICYLNIVLMIILLLQSQNPANFIEILLYQNIHSFAANEIIYKDNRITQE